ncbi:MAG: Lrp/AsnC family transcriptional regulator [Thermoplasmata archaeon]|nr:Lrp/AsnC family transcriptional regulator [Thermoplasmata archaeon]
MLHNPVLQELLRDPTRGINEIARRSGTYRQGVWRLKKRLEEEKAIWGYTPVLAEEKFGYGQYLILLKLKPMSEKLASLMIRRIRQGEPAKYRVRLINVMYVNGDFDWIVLFSAPDRLHAKKYYESLRLTYDEFLIEKPVLLDVNMFLVREGKTNPELENLTQMVP